jgi:hypothetical protein
MAVSGFPFYLTARANALDPGTGFSVSTLFDFLSTAMHEIGHAVGMQHTRNFEDIMYSFAYGGDFVEYFSRYRRKIKSRSDIARVSGLSPGDISVLKSLFAGATPGLA